MAFVASGWTTSDSCLGHVVATRSIALPGCNTCSPARADIWSEKKPTRNAEWLSETNQKRVWKIGHDQIWWLIVIFPIEVTMLGASPIFGQSPNDFPKAQRMLPWLFDAMGIVGPPWTLRTLRAFQQWNGCSVHGHEKAGKKHGFTISICTCVLKHVGNRKQSLSSAVPACLLIVVVGLPLLSVVDNPRALHRSHLAHLSHAHLHLLLHHGLLLHCHLLHHLQDFSSILNLVWLRILNASWNNCNLKAKWQCSKASVMPLYWMMNRDSAGGILLSPRYRLVCSPK